MGVRKVLGAVQIDLITQFLVESFLLSLAGFILFAFMWVRGTLPRFRYDQLMGFTWKFLFPVAMLNLLVTGFLVAWFS